MGARSARSLVGRVGELETLRRALESIVERPDQVVVLTGEPGIGKSALLAHLAQQAPEHGAVVRSGRASEFEVDLPHALWREVLGEAVVSDSGRGDRHGLHTAMRELLEQLSADAPLLVCLDDVHWADPASLDSLTALVRRPPAGPILMALAFRHGQIPPAVGAALSEASREDRVTWVALEALSEAEAAELVGERARAIFAQAGGNPFYLQALARAGDGAGADSGGSVDASVPAVVASALSAELDALGPMTRRMLDGAAVAGDPFEAGLAAAVAELSDEASYSALDDLLAVALVKETSFPRRFAFRHPVVRRVVYETAPGGWRLGAHARAAAALKRAGYGPVERAHHVERAAGLGDEEAIGLLEAAADELRSRAPAAAARFRVAALRLLPTGAEYGDRRARMQGMLADAQAAAGDPFAALATLLEALGTAPIEHRLALTVAAANSEWWIGRDEDARRRLQVVLAEQPAAPSPDRIRLHLAVAVVALSAGELDEVLDHVSDARDDARAIADPVFEAAALSLAALASVTRADGAHGAAGLAEASAALERLSAEQLATRLPAFWMHGRSRYALGEFEHSLRDLERGASIAAETGRLTVRLLLTLESVAPLIELGRIGDAISRAEESLEIARLSGIPRVLVWARSALASALLAAGDVPAALRQANAAADVDAPAGFHTAGQPGWALGNALTAAGNADRAVSTLLDAFGGPDLRSVLPAHRPAAAADLAEAQLACGDADAAEAMLVRGRELATCSGVTWLAAMIDLGWAALLLARGRPKQALAAAAAAGEVTAGAPLLRARARVARGKALAAAGERPSAIETLVLAEAELDSFGALRRRDDAVRELRALGHRVLRPARDSPAGAIGPLTSREAEIAQLVAAGRTNREIGEQLVLSTRTIEAHLRNIYRKLDVRSRIELAQQIPSAQRTQVP